jgi:hypothetical protein
MIRENFIWINLGVKNKKTKKKKKKTKKTKKQKPGNWLRKISNHGAQFRLQVLVFLNIRL